MMILLILLAVLGLVVYGLERNHRRTMPGRMAGSTDVENRDEARVSAELAARDRVSG
ncbi:hypothetical protein [Amycolatopsis acidicola]|uniref:hypothetical protein n=1 Tax=Amycolatopsis acidicola TaxID=2596893 RepID=UPI00140DD634|nr:hypothetical protein [Amycolatopsis acidicola]